MACGCIKNGLKSKSSNLIKQSTTNRGTVSARRYTTTPPKLIPNVSTSNKIVRLDGRTMRRKTAT